MVSLPSLPSTSSPSPHPTRSNHFNIALENKEASNNSNKTYINRIKLKYQKGQSKEKEEKAQITEINKEIHSGSMSLFMLHLYMYSCTFRNSIKTLNLKHIIYAEDGAHRGSQKLKQQTWIPHGSKLVPLHMSYGCVS